MTLKAVIRSSIVISPETFYLSGTEHQDFTKKLEITSMLDKPLEISPLDFSFNNQFTYNIEEVEKGKKFNIVIAGTFGSPENFNGYLKLKTNYSEKPEISIPIRGRIKKGKKTDGTSVGEITKRDLKK